MALHPIVKKLRADVRAVDKELKDLAKEIKQEGEDFKDDVNVCVHNFVLNTTAGLQEKYDFEYLDTINSYARNMKAYKKKVHKLRTKLINTKDKLRTAERVHGKK